MATILLLTVFQITLIYFLSRLTIRELLYFLRIFLNREKTVYSLVSAFFFPGTVIHEMAHFLMATVLNLRVHEVRLFPQWEKNQIKLGSVLYEKKDFIRGILVGIAPIFIALFFFWFLAQFNLFPQNNFILNILFGYIIFTISSTMFSSRQDLIDFILIIPIIVFIAGLIYVFNLKLDILLNNHPILKKMMVDFFQTISFFLWFSLAINLVLLVGFRSLRFLIKR